MKKYSSHEIADVYPMMSDSELQTLISSMETGGYDENQPIYLFENKILDGRNRYKAAQKAGITPAFKDFTGTYEEAEEKSRLLNSNRRHLSTAQKAMIAAKVIKKSREDATKKKITISAAAHIYAVSSRSINDALQILQADEDIAKLVFEGKCNIKCAKYKIEEIEHIKNPPKEADEHYGGVQHQPQQIQQSQQSAVLDEALSEAEEEYEAIKDRMIDNSSAFETLKEQLRECMQEKQELLGKMAM